MDENGPSNHADDAGEAKPAKSGIELGMSTSSSPVKSVGTPQRRVAKKTPEPVGAAKRARRRAATAEQSSPSAKPKSSAKIRSESPATEKAKPRARATAEPAPEAPSAEMFGFGPAGGSAWQENAVELQRKVSEFTQANISAGLGFWREIMSRRDPAEVLSLQQSFMHESMSTLARQARDLSEISSRLTEEAMRPMQQMMFRPTGQPDKATGG